MATSLLEQTSTSPGLDRGEKTSSKFITIYLAPLAITFLGVVLACLAYSQFLEKSRYLWSSVLHDRHAHYNFGQNLALDLRQGNVFGFLRDLDGGGRVWGPLHGVGLGLLLAVGGVDYRLAVWPSLAAWVGTLVCLFLVTRRAAARGGNVAGLVAVLFFLASPAHAAFATDVMLESTGAFLTLLAIYWYLVARQESAFWVGRALGLVLTALFLHKYNYWLLVLFGLVGVEVAAHFAQLLAWVKADWQTWDRSAWLRRQLRHPLTYVLALILLAVAVVKIQGGGTLQFGPWTVSLQHTHNLLHAAYVVFFFRLWSWWRASGRAWVGTFEFRSRQLVYWHLWPMAIWFLWPQRLGNFLWYIFPLSNVGERPVPLFPEGLNFYLDSWRGDYHLGLWSVLVVLGLLTGLAWLGRKFRRRGAVLVWFVVIAAAITLHHPNRKSRFLHSWITGTWALAGVGLAHLLYSRATPLPRLWRPGLGTLAIGGLALLHGPVFLPAHAVPEGGPKPSLPSALDLTDCYLPELADARRVTIISNRPLKFLTCWTCQEYYQLRDRRRLVIDLKGLADSPTENRTRFAQWLQTTDCDALVFLAVPKGTHFYEDVLYPNYDQVVEMLAKQKVFTLARRWDFPNLGGPSVTLWKRIPAP